jgi:hypothetical protein
MALPRGLPQVSDTGKLLGALDYNVVDTTTDKLTATTAIGSPAAGFFHSTITNRASIPDISKDLSVRMGIERIPVQQAYQLQDEFGPNNQPVWSAVNDYKGLVRFVGNMSNVVNASAARVNFNSSGDYAEITFYGTGLNILLDTYAAAQNLQVSVDGGSLSSNLWVGTTYSNAIGVRNYATNQTINAASDLSLGIHTVKLVLTTATAGMAFFGFEIINESSTLNVRPGSAYVDGKELILAAAESTSYNSGFTNIYGTAGTRGGRVLTYLASDGTVKKDVQYVDTAPAYLTSANHINEEVIRTYFPREFGAARTDDFSFYGVGSTILTFTLDDGTTTLSGKNVGFAGEGISVSGNNGFLIITFVGTGLDIERFDDVNTGGPETAYTYSVDGTPQGTFASTGSTVKRIQKIVSGLPYGTHTVKISRGTATFFTPRFSKFIVYGPKKPALPVGAVELADYNLMANFTVNVAVDSNGVDVLGVISNGVLRKNALREITYVGSNWLVLGPASSTTGFAEQYSTAINEYFEYTFFGTGFVWSSVNEGQGTVQFQLQSLSTGGSLVDLNSSNFSFTSASTSPNFGAFNAVNGRFTYTLGGVQYGNSLAISGLTLGLYKVRAYLFSTGAITVSGLDIITPIHSPKSNTDAAIQNTLAVGSCAISDNRKTSVSNKNLPIQKAWAQAFPVVNGAPIAYSTSSISAVPIPEMNLTIKTNGSPIEVNFISRIGFSGSIALDIMLYVDGVYTGIGVSYFNANDSAANIMGIEPSVNLTGIVPVSAGTHSVSIYWKVSGGTASTRYNSRIFNVREF